MIDTDTEARRLLGEAHAALRRWDVSGAKSAIFVALKLAQQNRAYEAEHCAWMALAIAQRALDDHHAALHSLLSAESAARAANDVLALACARMSRCACLVGVGRIEDALALRAALARVHGDEVMARAAITPNVDVSLLISLGNELMQIDLNKARMAFERAIAVTSEPAMAAWAYAGLGRALDLMGDHRAAAPAFTRLAELAEELEQTAFAADARTWAVRAEKLASEMEVKRA